MTDGEFRILFVADVVGHPGRDAVKALLPGLTKELRPNPMVVNGDTAAGGLVYCDMHAEATSEKTAMGWYLNGRVSAVVGTHTHIPTADARILPGGTAYVTDVGMVGPRDGCIGMDKDVVVQRFLSGVPNRFVVASGPVTFNSVLVTINLSTGRATTIQRVDREHI